MDTFADYILSEKDCIEKMEIMCYLHNKKDVFFDKSVILKTFLAKTFINTMELDVDDNLVITACLLYACKKDIASHDIEKIRRYATDGANYLETLGFSKRFCKICSEVNRYTNEENRERESDILELVDNFGGLVLDRPERKGFPIDIAMTVLKDRNLKGLNNIYLEKFKFFVSLNEETKNFRVLKNLEIVYKPNSEFNPEVEELIKAAKSAETPEDYISYLSGAKEIVKTEERIMQKLKKIKSTINGRTNIGNV